MAKVRAGQGWHWVGQALGMARKYPGIFPVMGLIVSAIALVPLLGGLAIAILGPALVAGSVIATRDATAGRKPQIGQLFQLFAEQRAGGGIALCLPVILSQIVAGMVLVGAVSARLTRAGVDLKSLESNPSELMQNLTQYIGPGFLGWIIVAVIIALIGYAFAALAIPRVGLDRKPAMQAMAESFRTVRRHWGAWLLTGLALFLCMFIPVVVFYVLGSSLIAQFVANAVLYTLLGPTLYFAYSDLYGGPDAATDDHGTAPDASAPPPPPSFEA
ncbi:BPSS1780 family membrane protein [Oleiagrimonas sp. C23AA]|uniref:BPSS1780 family membrane protein n=1 Tax=Oleiagrimonas sp. C23AA TaxID=2719047 RepID=UPI0014213D44|nr:BPSS1780 family membrane protein [Oleiagrimonas sp. C23AA]NII12215.1 hypothetical protein [Oleiagrimonas sp. C23AA]